ncbi:hypothetical protein Poly51_17950 [Rubripirellula tenax]|uniref:Uncharacterized protein n=1 Tax=Rubripirellula tenax TaxID=2528015 RepID=A0A5C6FEI4_9BACT|nr:hypothetical protein [Rubripirellula tenax]TWU59010.1 hypothetical protein Poly51_17950 [Rubripirellula tenax]
MSKNDDLKRRLKAADRRRARRPLASASTANSAVAYGDEDSSSTNRVDVTGLCIVEILKLDDKRTFRDSEVLTAMRSCLTGGTPSSAEAQLLSQRFEAISQREDVSEREYRDALQGLVRNALNHRNQDDDSAFIQFLSVLAS